MTTTNFEPHLFGEALLSALRSRDLSIVDLARVMDITYEHGRKLSKGLAFPSKYLLRSLCDKLELNYLEMEKKVTADKIRKKHGTIPLELAGKDPRFENFEHVLVLLEDSQLEDLYVIAKAMVQRNERSRIDNR